MRFLQPCTLLLPLPAAHTLMTMSWAVTAWPPVGVWEACALLRSSPLTGHCFETLLAWLPQHFLCSFQLGFFREIPCSRARCFSPPAAHMLMTMSWAVTAWPPVGVWEACALLRSSPLTGHCFDTLLAHLPRHFCVFISVGFFP